MSSEYDITQGPEHPSSSQDKGTLPVGTAKNSAENSLLNGKERLI